MGRNTTDTIAWLASLPGAELSKYAPGVEEHHITGAKLTQVGDLQRPSTALRTGLRS